LQLQDLLAALVSALQTLPASRYLPSNCGGKNLLDDMSKLMTVVNTDDFGTDRITPLLKADLNDEPDEVTWNKVYDAIAESTLPLPSRITLSTNTIAPQHGQLRELHVDVPDLFEAFFGDVAGLDPAAQAVFDKCKEGDNPFYREESGW
ncbi:hypothetical protein M501DRAFT_909691, partial [Patellaria atrata CBS 101060]